MSDLEPRSAQGGPEGSGARPRGASGIGISCFRRRRGSRQLAELHAHACGGAPCRRGASPALHAPGARVGGVAGTSPQNCTVLRASAILAAPRKPPRAHSRRARAGFSGRRAPRRDATPPRHQAGSRRAPTVKSVDIHPVEPWVLSAMYNGHVFLWNYNTQSLVKSFEVSDQPVRAGKFVTRKQWIVAGPTTCRCACTTTTRWRR